MSVYVVEASPGLWAILPERDLGSGLNTRNWSRCAGDFKILGAGIDAVFDAEEDGKTALEAATAGVRAMEAAIVEGVRAKADAEAELPDWAVEAVAHRRLGLSQWRAISLADVREMFVTRWASALLRVLEQNHHPLEVSYLDVRL